MLFTRISGTSGNWFPCINIELTTVTIFYLFKLQRTIYDSSLKWPPKLTSFYFNSIFIVVQIYMRSIFIVLEIRSSTFSCHFAFLAVYDLFSSIFSFLKHWVIAWANKKYIHQRGIYARQISDKKISLFKCRSIPMFPIQKMVR